MIQRNTLFVPGTIVLAAMLAACGTAQAQQSLEHSPLSGSFDKPLGAMKGGGSSSSHSGQANTRIVISENNGTDSFSLAMSGDDIEVKHNNKRVPSDRLRRSDGKVEVLDEKGAVIHTFEIGNFGGQQVVRGWASSGGGQNALAIATPSDDNPPPVMVGMLMEFSEQDSGLVVQRVFDGMPAQQGGVVAGDIITKIDGKDVTGNQSLRDELRTRKAGDHVTLTVSREGDVKELKITLVQYDRAAMDKARGEHVITLDSDDVTELRGFEAPMGRSLEGIGGDFSDDIKSAIKRALSSIKENAPAQIESWRNEVISELEQALAETESKSGEVRRQLRELRAQSPRSRGQTMFFREMPGQVFVAPKAPTPPAAPSAPAYPAQAERQAGSTQDRLIQALDRLNERLDKIEKRLDDKDGKK